MSYSGNANFYGAETLSVTATDIVYGTQATGSGTITVADTAVPSVAAGGTVKVTEGTGSATIALLGNYMTSAFVASAAICAARGDAASVVAASRAG
jgi:hypothetical protein